MSDIPNWLGDLPTWITTLAIVLAAGQLLIERSKRAAEQERERRVQATKLASWVVVDADCTPKVHGVVISNSSMSTFHAVRIDCVMHGEAVSRPITLTVLPPGRYFVGKLGPGEEYRWEFAIEAEAYDGWLRPLMNSSKYQVTSMRFTDNLGQTWRTDEHALLSPT